MKKIYLLAASFALCTAGMAQVGNNSSAEPLRAPAGIPIANSNDRPTQAPPVVDNSRFTVIWEDDFSDQSNWEMNNTSSPAVDWIITTDVNLPPYTPLTPVMFPTAENGYALVDGDSQGDGSQQNSNIRMVESLDLSEYDAVNLRFYCVTRNWSSTYTVRVSPDGGDNWTNFPVLPHITTNTDTDNPELVVVNITSVAAGASQVLVEWNFTADWGWFWAIDDVSIVIPDENDVSIGSASYGAYDPDVSVDWRDVEYSIYPISQLRPLTFSANASNAGVNPQTDVYLEVHIDGPDTDMTLTSASQNIPFAETATFTIDGFTPPATPGTYTVTYTVIQNEEDANPDDNVATRTFMVDEAMYARDRNGSAFTSNVGLGEFWGGPGFYIEENANLYCIGAALGSTSVPGTFFDFELRDGFDIEFLAATNSAEVHESMLNGAGDENFTWLAMEDGAIPLFAGDDYVAMFHHYGGADVVSVSISMNNAPDFTSYVIAQFETQNCDPCYTGSTYMVRMGLSEEFCDAVVWTNVEEIAQVTMNDLYPNPTAGLTTLEYTLLENANVQLFLFDNMGRVVMNKDMGTQSVGEYRFDQDFSHLAGGMYTFSIQVNSKYVNKKLVIK
jgi:hypothetical protein